MAATNVITTGTSAVTSSDITVSAGTTKQFILKDADGGGIGYKAEIFLEVKDDGGQYTTYDSVTNDKTGLGVTAGVADMVIRWRRPAGGASCGLAQI